MKSNQKISTKLMHAAVHLKEQELQVRFNAVLHRFKLFPHCFMLYFMLKMMNLAAACYLWTAGR